MRAHTHTHTNPTNNISIDVVVGSSVIKSLKLYLLCICYYLHEIEEWWLRVKLYIGAAFIKWYVKCKRRIHAYKSIWRHHFTIFPSAHAHNSHKNEISKVVKKYETNTHITKKESYGYKISIRTHARTHKHCNLLLRVETISKSENWKWLQNSRQFIKNMYAAHRTDSMPLILFCGRMNTHLRSLHIVLDVIACCFFPYDINLFTFICLRIRTINVIWKIRNFHIVYLQRKKKLNAYVKFVNKIVSSSFS